MSSREALGKYWSEKFGSEVPPVLAVDVQERRLRAVTDAILSVFYGNEQYLAEYWFLLGINGVAVVGSYGRVPDEEFGPHESLAHWGEQDMRHTDVDGLLVARESDIPSEAMVAFQWHVADKLKYAEFPHRVVIRDFVLTSSYFEAVRSGRFWWTRYGYRIITRNEELLREFDPSVYVS